MQPTQVQLKFVCFFAENDLSRPCQCQNKTFLSFLPEYRAARRAGHTFFLLGDRARTQLGHFRSKMGIF